MDLMAVRDNKRLWELDQTLVLDNDFKARYKIDGEGLETDIYVITGEEGGKNIVTFGHSPADGLLVGLDDSELFNSLLEWLQVCVDENDITIS
ncbi:hypothetical protein [Jeotgalibacillus haloalkalitolerans]|uniref:SMI1/KNR4 family protein n=1 Tax=Jeotgalibacillus haloalkalitolerans TaxID=3104292 RepID=A0ABU5KLQ3_9BACL|nr:hypothetical protein [Jeotgalibacillus sp. HH7-29]MDZ5711645.1 hypothetical protein [Jeotgalibacillus sp. HH7-29]